MELLLKRLHKTQKSTIGELSINGKFECYTLEDIERVEKVKGKTAIPKGKYEVIMTMSNRFKVILPLLLNVPNYEGVRIHAGNTAENTEGCLLLGTTRGIDFIGNSKLAMSKFLPKLKEALKKEKVFITIE
jgi:hypothetical protein